MKVFISGSIKISKIPKVALEKIDNIIKKNFTIIIGDAKGVDLNVQKYIYDKKYEDVIVYYAGNDIRNNVGNWNVRNVESDKSKGRELYTLKDIEMANDADYGLMIWDGESEGTLKNINMMKNKNKKFFVIIGEMIIDDKNIDSIIKIKEIQNDNKNTQINLF